MADSEDHLDQLQELVTTSYWRAVKREAASLEQGLIARLATPMQSLPDLIMKEGNASRLAALRDFISEIEQKAERHAKRLRQLRS